MNHFPKMQIIKHPTTLSGLEVGYKDVVLTETYQQYILGKMRLIKF